MREMIEIAWDIFSVIREGVKKLAPFILMLLFFGNEGAAQTRVEESPGQQRLSPAEVKAPRVILLLIDKSGSMRDESKLEYVKQAVKATVRGLNAGDFIGVIGFDQSAFVIYSFEPASIVLRSLDYQIDRLKPGGRTDFYPALVQARNRIRGAPRGQLHLILISDGGHQRGEPELLDILQTIKLENDVVVSALAVGAKADASIMSKISQHGGGFFRHA
jgi:Ca-activated chloride channel homolog